METIKFILFMDNFTPGFIFEVWDKKSKELANHLNMKFKSLSSDKGYISAADFLSWFKELSEGNKLILIEWVNNNFKG